MFFKPRRRIMGYTDLGHIRIPPLPQFIIMTDRADGTFWELQWNTDTPSFDGNGYISITDTLSRKPDKTTYGPYEGPYVQEQNITQGSPIIKLLIRGGRLGYEMVREQSLQSIDNPPVLTRRVGSNTLREIIVPLTWRSESDTLGWRMV